MCAKKVDDCYDPVCSDKVKLFNLAMGGLNNASSSEEAKSDDTSPIEPYPLKAMPCPPDRAELGLHSWNLLHTTAAYFPDVPSDGISLRFKRHAIWTFCKPAFS